MFSASKTGAVSGGFQIANSLRFRSSASAYLNRTPASAGNRKTWTWSGWVKRGTLGSNVAFFGAEKTGTDWTVLNFDASNRLAFYSISSSPSPYVDYSVETVAVFRDPSAWYHVVVAVDTTQATAANRLIMYVNGVQQSVTNTYGQIDLNYDTWINSTEQHALGRNEDSGGTSYFDGYLAEINFVDGQALTPSSFGETSSTTGVWIPKRYTGSYGTNGFYLNFSNGTSTTTLGYDSSSNGNNWTTNNISLTSGSTYDWMIDSPTPYPGSSYGVGNYAVLNPLQAYNYNTSSALSNGNLTATRSSNYGSAIGTIAAASGKWYCEVTFTTDGTNNVSIGFIQPPTSSLTTNYANYAIVYAAIYPSGSSSGTIKNWSAVQSGLTSYSSGVLGIAIDIDALTCQFYVNGSTYGNQVTGLTAATYTFYAFNNASSGTSTSNVNFGQRPFAFSVPSGYKALNTYNLP